MVVLQLYRWKFSHKETLLQALFHWSWRLATLSGLRGNIHTPSIARWKAHGQVCIRHNWTFFRNLVRLRCYERKSVDVGVSRRGWVTFSADFRGKGASPTNRCWCQSSRVIALSCVIKISAVHHLDLSQSMRVTDRRTDKITTPKTALAYAQAVIMFSHCYTPWCLCCALVVWMMSRWEAPLTV